jgi:septal ring factor EnvC (AmiA/AmiB activator)
MPTKKEIEAKRQELVRDPKYGATAMGGIHLTKAGQAELDKFTKSGGSTAPTPVNLKYSPDKRNELTDQYNTLKNQIADLNKSKADKDAEFKQWSTDRKKDYDAFMRDRAADIAAANKIKDKKEKTNRLAEINADKTNRTREYNAEIADYKKGYDTFVKTEYPKTLADLNKQFGTVNKDYTAAMNEYKATEAQAKKLGVDIGEYENQIYGQTQQRQQDTNLAQVAAERGMTVDQLRQVQNQKQADETLVQQKAAKAAEDQAAAQAQAARMAQVQAQQQEYAKAMAQRKAQNDAQVYQLLTQNMPSPVGYQQGPTSRQAQTTMIGAGGDQGGIYGPQQQMSPGQIAAMRGQFMAQAQGEPDMQGVPRGIASAQQAPQTQQAPVAVKRGGYIRGY